MRWKKKYLLLRAQKKKTLRFGEGEPRALAALNDQDVNDHVSIASSALYSAQDEAAVIDTTELPGLRPEASYPWQAVDTIDEETGKSTRYDLCEFDSERKDYKKP